MAAIQQSQRGFMFANMLHQTCLFCAIVLSDSVTDLFCQPAARWRVFFCFLFLDWGEGQGRTEQLHWLTEVSVALNSSSPASSQSLKSPRSTFSNVTDVSASVAGPCRLPGTGPVFVLIALQFLFLVP